MAVSELKTIRFTNGLIHHCPLRNHHRKNAQNNNHASSVFSHLKVTSTQQQWSAFGDLTFTSHPAKKIIINNLRRFALMMIAIFISTTTAATPTLLEYFPTTPKKFTILMNRPRPTQPFLLSSSSSFLCFQMANAQNEAVVNFNFPTYSGRQSWTISASRTLVHAQNAIFTNAATPNVVGGLFVGVARLPNEFLDSELPMVGASILVENCNFIRSQLNIDFSNGVFRTRFNTNAIVGTNITIINNRFMNIGYEFPSPSLQIIRAAINITFSGTTPYAEISGSLLRVSETSITIADTSVFTVPREESAETKAKTTTAISIDLGQNSSLISSNVLITNVKTNGTSALWFNTNGLQRVVQSTSDRVAGESSPYITNKPTQILATGNPLSPSSIVRLLSAPVLVNNTIIVHNASSRPLLPTSAVIEYNMSSQINSNNTFHHTRVCIMRSYEPNLSDGVAESTTTYGGYAYGMCEGEKQDADENKQVITQIYTLDRNSVWNRYVLKRPSQYQRGGAVKMLFFPCETTANTTQLPPDLMGVKKLQTFVLNNTIINKHMMSGAWTQKVVDIFIASNFVNTSLINPIATTRVGSSPELPSMFVERNVFLCRNVTMSVMFYADADANVVGTAVTFTLQTATQMRQFGNQVQYFLTNGYSGAGTEYKKNEFIILDCRSNGMFVKVLNFNVTVVDVNVSKTSSANIVDGSNAYDYMSGKLAAQGMMSFTSFADNQISIQNPTCLAARRCMLFSLNGRLNNLKVNVENLSRPYNSTTDAEYVGDDRRPLIYFYIVGALSNSQITVQKANFCGVQVTLLTFYAVANSFVLANTFRGVNLFGNFNLNMGGVAMTTKEDVYFVLNKIEIETVEMRSNSVNAFAVNFALRSTGDFTTNTFDFKNLQKVGDNGVVAKVYVLGFHASNTYRFYNVTYEGYVTDGVDFELDATVSSCNFTALLVAYTILSGYLHASNFNLGTSNVMIRSAAGFSDCYVNVGEIYSIANGFVFRGKSDIRRSRFEIRDVFTQPPPTSTITSFFGGVAFLLERYVSVVDSTFIISSVAVQYPAINSELSLATKTPFVFGVLFATHTVDDVSSSIKMTSSKIAISQISIEAAIMSVRVLNTIFNFQQSISIGLIRAKLTPETSTVAVGGNAVSLFQQQWEDEPEWHFFRPAVIRITNTSIVVDTTFGGVNISIVGDRQNTIVVRNAIGVRQEFTTAKGFYKGLNTSNVFSLYLSSGSPNRQTLDDPLEVYAPTLVLIENIFNFALFAVKGDVYQGVIMQIRNVNCSWNFTLNGKDRYGSTADSGWRARNGFGLFINVTKMTTRPQNSSGQISGFFNNNNLDFGGDASLILKSVLTLGELFKFVPKYFNEDVWQPQFVSQLTRASRVSRLLLPLSPPSLILLNNVDFPAVQLVGTLSRGSSIVFSGGGLAQASHYRDNYEAQWGSDKEGTGVRINSGGFVVSMSANDCNASYSCLLLIENSSITHNVGAAGAPLLIEHSTIDESRLVSNVFESHSMIQLHKNNFATAANATVNVLKITGSSVFGNMSQFSILRCDLRQNSQGYHNVVFVDGIQNSILFEIWGNRFYGGIVSFATFNPTSKILIVNNTVFSARLLGSGTRNVEANAIGLFNAGCNVGNTPANIAGLFGDQILCSDDGVPLPSAAAVAVQRAQRCALHLSFFYVPPSSSSTIRSVLIAPGNQTNLLELPCFANANASYYDGKEEDAGAKTRSPTPHSASLTLPGATESKSFARSSSLSTVTTESMPMRTTRTSGVTKTGSLLLITSTETLQKIQSKTHPPPQTVTTAAVISRTPSSSPPIPTQDDDDQGGNKQLAVTPTKTLTVVPIIETLKPIPAMEKAAIAASSAVGVAVAAASVVSVSGGQLGVANAMLRMASCEDGGGDGGEGGSGSGDAKKDVELPILVHPFQFGFGQSEARHYAAAAVSNTVFIPLLVALVTWGPVAKFVAMARNYPSRHEALSSIGWPSLLMLPFVTLGEGIGVSIVKSLGATIVRESSADGNNNKNTPTGDGDNIDSDIDILAVVMGVIGLCAVALFIGMWVWALIKKLPRASMQLVPNPDIHQQQTSNDKAQPLHRNPKRSRKKASSSLFRKLIRIFQPTKIWIPIADPKTDETRNDAEIFEAEITVEGSDVALMAPSTGGSNEGQQLGGSRAQQQTAADRIDNVNNPPEKKNVKEQRLLQHYHNVEQYGNVVGDKRFYYAELLSFICSLAVGAAEGFDVSSSSSACRSRGVSALLFATLQCLCSVTAVTPFELVFQVMLSICIIPLSVLVTVKVFDDSSSTSATNDGSSSNSDMLATNFNIRLDDAMSAISLVGNVVGVVLLFSSLLSAFVNLATAGRRQMMARLQKKQRRFLSRKTQQNQRPDGEGDDEDEERAGFDFLLSTTDDDSDTELNLVQTADDGSAYSPPDVQLLSEGEASVSRERCGSVEHSNQETDGRANGARNGAGNPTPSSSSSPAPPSPLTTFFGAGSPYVIRRSQSTQQLHTAQQQQPENLLLPFPMPERMPPPQWQTEVLDEIDEIIERQRRERGKK